MINIKQYLTDIRYIIVGDSQVKEVEVVKVFGSFCTIKFKDTDTIIKVRESNLYKTMEDALSNASTR